LVAYHDFFSGYQFSIKTYSPTLNQYNTNAISQYTITNLNLYDDPAPFQLLSTQSVTGNATVNYNWGSLQADSTYEWYATVADTGLTTTSSINKFTASTNPVVNLGNDTTLACGQQLTLNAANAGKTFLWSNGATTQTISASLTGNYNVKVTNPITSCFKSDTIHIAYNNLPTVAITLSNQTTTCQGGSATLTATAGMAVYSWSTGASTNAITVSTAGTYSVFVTDSAGCQNSASTSVSFSPALSGTYTVTNVSCNGGNNGAANITVIGGTTPYTYLWSNAATTQNISAVTAANYSVTITDNIGCILTLNPVVTQPTVLALTAPTYTLTNGGYNGTIKINPTGGTSPYTYLWRYNNAGTAPTTQSISTTHVGGVYTFTVTDTKGCKVSNTYSHAIPVVASATVLLPWSSTWKYKDDGTNQNTAWKGTAFDDSTWPSAAAEFGYGDGDETTLINACGAIVQTPSCTNKYITTYLRKVINISDINLFQNIKFNAFRDDGIVVYVNNNEVYRSNMPTGTITYTLGASTGVADDGETLQTQTVAVASSFFTTGNNTVAVEVHQQIGTSSDVTFNMEILGVAPVPEVLTRGPYLMKATKNTMEVKWLTDLSANSKVRYGTVSGVYTDSVIDATSTTSHVINLTGLQPDTKYYYTIGSTARQLQGDANNNFRTPPVPGTDGKYNFWLVGDCGNNSTNQAQVRDAYINYMGSNTTNGWLLLGDNAYSNGADAEYQAEFFNVYQGTVSKNMPLYPTPGNHDYVNGTVYDHTPPYYSIFDMPSAGEAGGVASNTEAYYSYDYGNIHFLSLDSYGKEDGVNRLYDTLGQQVQWIKQDLAANTKKWVVAYWHHPPYTMGSHNSDTEAELTKMHTNFIQILERYKVDLIVCGHSHEYERSKLIKGSYGNEASFNPAVHNLSQSNGRYDGTASSCTYVKDSTHTYNGTVYVVSGSAGQLDGSVQAAWPHNAMSAYNNSTNGGSMLLTVEGNRLDSKWICADGVVRDQFTMIKDANKVRNYSVNYGQALTLTASWKGQYSWNNGGATTQSINVNPTANFQYIAIDQYQCVADTFNVTVIMPAINTVINNSTVCSGSTFKIPVTTSNTLANGNIFTAQLSNASGNFLSPVSIGTLTATTTDSLTVTIPTNTLGGSNYKIRITSSNSSVTGSASNSFAVSNAPVLTFASNDLDNAICLGTSITYTASGANSYQFFIDSVSQGAAGATNTLNTSSLTQGQHLIVVVGYNACGNGTANIVTTVNSLPTANITGQTIFCAGDSTILSATAATGYLWSNGATTQIIKVITSGNYSVAVSDANGCSANSSALNVTENEPTITTISAGSATTFCIGDSVSLSATNNNSYLWSNGATTQTINVITSGNYSVAVSDANGCSATSLPTNVLVNALPTATISAEGNTTFCEGESVMLNATNGMSSYLWSNGAVTQSDNITSSGNYSVTVTNANGCSATSLPINVTVNPLPISTITADGSTTFIVPASVILTANPASQYSWSNGATTQSITVKVSGTYSVTITSVSNCTATSAGVVVTAHALISDTNMDGITNATDFLLMLGVFNQFCTCPDDLNHDGIVNTTDFLILLSQFGQSYH
jgi:Calcineurin-like phosphoesterase/SprB repeat/Purple acid Phosphatase, N-terminal domain